MVGGSNRPILQLLEFRFGIAAIYRVKHDLLDDYLRQQLKSPGIQMRLA
jgi:hypothetical protein